MTTITNNTPAQINAALLSLKKEIEAKESGSGSSTVNNYTIEGSGSSYTFNEPLEEDNNNVSINAETLIKNNNILTTSDKGVANGVATLDENSRIPYSQLPESAMEFKGSWDAETNTPTLVNGEGVNGDFYVVSVAGTQFGITFNVNDRIIYNGSTNEWEWLGGALDLSKAIGTLSIDKGGTGATTANDAIKNIIDNATTKTVTDSNSFPISDGTNGGKTTIASLYEDVIKTNVSNDFSINDNGTYSGTATKAIQDQNGNVINTTYATKTEAKGEQVYYLTTSSTTTEKQAIKLDYSGLTMGTYYGTELRFPIKMGNLSQNFIHEIVISILGTTVRVDGIITSNYGISPSGSSLSSIAYYWIDTTNKLIYIWSLNSSYGISVMPPTMLQPEVVTLGDVSGYTQTAVTFYYPIAYSSYRAYRDGSGNIITSTYATKDEVTAAYNYDETTATLYITTPSSSVSLASDTGEE